MCVFFGGGGVVGTSRLVDDSKLNPLKTGHLLDLAPPIVPWKKVYPPWN